MNGAMKKIADYLFCTIIVYIAKKYFDPDFNNINKKKKEKQND